MYCLGCDCGEAGWGQKCVKVEKKGGTCTYLMRTLEHSRTCHGEVTRFLTTLQRRKNGLLGWLKLETVRSKIPGILTWQSKPSKAPTSTGKGLIQSGSFNGSRRPESFQGCLRSCVNCIILFCICVFDAFTFWGLPDPGGTAFSRGSQFLEISKVTCNSKLTCEWAFSMETNQVSHTSTTSFKGLSHSGCLSTCPNCSRAR